MLLLFLMMVALIGVILLGDYNQVKDAKRDIFERKDIDDFQKEILWRARKNEL